MMTLLFRLLSSWRQQQQQNHRCGSAVRRSGLKFVFLSLWLCCPTDPTVGFSLSASSSSPSSLSSASASWAATITRTESRRIKRISTWICLNNNGDSGGSSSKNESIKNDIDHDDEDFTKQDWYQPALELWTRRAITALNQERFQDGIHFEERFQLEIRNGKTELQNRYRPNNIPSSEIYIQSITHGLRENPKIDWYETPRGVIYKLNKHSSDKESLEAPSSFRRNGSNSSGSGDNNLSLPSESSPSRNVTDVVTSPTRNKSEKEGGTKMILFRSTSTSMSRQHQRRMSSVRNCYRCSAAISNYTLKRIWIVFRILFRKFWRNYVVSSVSSINEKQHSSMGWIRKQRFKSRKVLRYVRDKYTIYVLECENNKYYVGSTIHRKRRFKQHMQNDGSSWTKLHKPVRLIKEYRRIPERYYLGYEAQITAELMLEKGVNNVRGAMFTRTKDYTRQEPDIAALVAFLGHYCDLKYGKGDIAKKCL